MDQFNKQFEQDAQIDEDRLGKSGESQFISIKNKEFTFRSSALGEELEVVIINFASANVYYDSNYDKDDQNAPACCAIGLEDNEFLVPFENSPEMVNDNCEECEYNEWESADVGKGKKCGNRKILCLVQADTLEDEEIEYAFISVPPTSMSNYNKYVKGLSRTMKRPSYAVITQISFNEESDNEELVFKPVEPIESVNNMNTIMLLREQCEADMLAEPDFSQYHIVEKKTRRAATKKKAVATKKRASKFSK